MDICRVFAKILANIRGRKEKKGNGGEKERSRNFDERRRSLDRSNSMKNSKKNKIGTEQIFSNF